VGCYKVSSKSELIRFVTRGPSGVVFDERQTMPGRGFYLCPSRECFMAAPRNKRARGAISSSQAAQWLFHRVLDELAGSLREMLRGCGHAGRHTEGEGSSRVAGAVIVAGAAPGDVDLAPPDREPGPTAPVYTIPKDILGDRPMVVIDDKAPGFKALIRTVRLYERLCSGGRS